jgi:hypothetical protein
MGSTHAENCEKVKKILNRRFENETLIKMNENERWGGW